MADQAILEVIQISKKQNASKFKEGELYWQVDVTDGKTGRSARVFGDWAKDWKLGDMIPVIWEAGEPYNGKPQWKLKDPNEKPKTGGQNWGQRGAAQGATPLLVHAYMIAATCAPTLYKHKDKVKLVDISELAEAILAKLKTDTSTAQPQPAQQTQPAQPVAAPVAQTPAPVQQVVNTTPQVSDDFEEDDDKPF